MEQKGNLIIGSMAAGSLHCYAAMMRFADVVIDAGERHLPLRHSHHRYYIDGANGVQMLTVPLVGDTNTMTTAMRDVLISEHGDWRARHWGALFSTYGKSPYFDYLAADLHHILVEKKQRFLLDLNMDLHRLIVDFMDLPVKAAVTDAATVPVATDWRGLLGGKKGDKIKFNDVRYYQVWQEKHGFLPNLSILDLACNTGREGIKVLVKMSAGI